MDFVQGISRDSGKDKAIVKGIIQISENIGIDVCNSSSNEVNEFEEGIGMAFWVFMTAMVLLIPLTMIVLGRCFIESAPKKINAIVGYRTLMSMKNQDTWQFAHHYAGKVCWKMGWVLLLISLVFMLLLWGKSSDEIGWIAGIFTLVQIIPLMWVIYATEKALKRTFDKDGNRKK